MIFDSTHFSIFQLINLFFHIFSLFAFLCLLRVCLLLWELMTQSSLILAYIMLNLICAKLEHELVIVLMDLYEFSYFTCLFSLLQPIFYLIYVCLESEELTTWA